MDKSLGKMAEKFNRTNALDVVVGVFMSPVFGVALLAKFIVSITSSKI